MRAPPPEAPGATGHITGLAELLRKAKVTGTIADLLVSDVVATGAVHVDELSLSDWQSLPSWPQLRPMEARRLAAAVQAGS